MTAPSSERMLQAAFSLGWGCLSTPVGKAMGAA